MSSTTRWGNGSAALNCRRRSRTLRSSSSTFRKSSATIRPNSRSRVHPNESPKDSMPAASREPRGVLVQTGPRPARIGCEFYNGFQLSVLSASLPRERGTLSHPTDSIKPFRADASKPGLFRSFSTPQAKRAS